MQSATHMDAPAATAVAQVSAASAPLDLAELVPAPAPNPADAINREGRVIQRGRFSEAPPAGIPPGNDVVELNYEQEDLRLVFEQLGDALGLNMVIDPGIDFRVSVRTSAANPLRYADIWPLLRALARSAGVSIEQSGNVYQFRRDDSRVPAELVLPEFLSQASAAEVLQVTPLRYLSIDAAEAVLAPLLQPEGRVIRLGSGNLLGLSGTPKELARVNALLAVIDDDPFQNHGIRLYDLSHSKASDVAQELSNVLQLIEGAQPAYQVLGLDRINAVLVVAPASRGFTEVDRWVNLLDAQVQEQVEQLFVYKVKNLDAVALAQTLNAAFGQPNSSTDRQDAPRQVRPFASPLVPNQVPLEAAPFQIAPPPNSANAPGGDAVSANLQVTIVADANTNSLLVRAAPREYRQLLSTIASLDRIPAQVLINAVIGQVTLTDGTKFGIDWSVVSENLGSGASNLSTNFLPNLFDTTTNQPLAGTGVVLARSFMQGSAAIDATLNAIAKNNEVRLLSRPTLLALNKQEGVITVGQKVPVNNGSTATNFGTTQNIGYTNVGIELTVTPQINDDGYINMKIEQHLSSLASSTVGVGNNPTFTEQQIITSAVVADQSTIALGGLIQEEASDLQSGVPLLMKIPLAGRLFSYTDNSKDRRELFVILRPQIIYGDARDTAAMQALRDSFSEVKKLFEDAGL
ncbi:MAG: type II secretion system secretin GspD [Pseudomonadales bacterium]|jgi:general secretion pathway protein D|nr:type II secretion system secretin GspD [Pseudomonadales bacterium]